LLRLLGNELSLDIKADKKGIMKTRRDKVVHEALRQIPYGLYVVGVRNKGNGEMNALAASWVTQCSFDPPLIMVAVRKPSLTYDLIKKGKVFSLNLLDKKERRVIRTLEKPARVDPAKLEKTPHREEGTGAPILSQAFAFVECEVRAIYEPGDHALVIGEAIHAGMRGEGKTLTCADLKWHYGG
jgi:flavin reductase (DIM6/NTAB) family NADH-FMN oxidoreductase RutF